MESILEINTDRSRTGSYISCFIDCVGVGSDIDPVSVIPIVLDSLSRNLLDSFPKVGSLFLYSFLFDRVKNHTRTPTLIH